MRGRLTARGGAIVVAAAFLVSRAIYLAAGVRFDTRPLRDFWQYIDPALLRHDLVESLWYFHPQPPLFNLYLGTVLKLGGSHARGLFAITFAALGLVGALALYDLVHRLGASPAVAAITSIAFFITPEAILYENWLYVEEFDVVCLIVAAACLHRFAEGLGRRYAVVAFSALAGVVLVRTLFHPVWLLLVVALVWLLQRERRREVLVAALVPVLVVVGLQVKATAQWHATSMTSCTGLSVWRVSTGQLPYAKRAELVARHELSVYSILNPFKLPAIDPGVFRRTRPRHVAVLDRPLKSTGAANVGHEAYLGICRHYMSDGLKVARKYPDAVRQGIERGVAIYWRPASEYDLFASRNRDAVDPVERVFTLLLGEARRATGPPDYSLGPQLARVAWVLLLAYVAAFVLGLRQILRRPASPFAIVAVLTLLSIVWVSVVGNVLEAGENNRFHFALDPLVLAMLVGFAVRWRCGGREAAA